MRRLILRALCVVAAIVAATTIVPETPLAQITGNQAGIVVVHDDGRVSYALVSFPEESIPGVELLHRSGFEVTEVTFGALGIGVCAIDETGCDVSVCRQRVCQGPGPDDPYWQYFIGGPDGQWSASALGVSSDEVRPGDVRAFVWSANEPSFAAPTVNDIASKAVDLVDDQSWLTRYSADGSVITESESDGATVPLPAFALVLAATVAAVGLVARSRLSSQS